MKRFNHLLQKRYCFYLLIFLFTFLARLVYGLCSPFWGTDEKQIYLLGLKYYATGNFPYYGPDVVYTQTQIPGALQGIVVGLPFFILPIPEAPFLLLNLLSTGTLILFAYYLHKRIPTLSGWLIYGWLLTAPWTLNYSTHIVNPSYVLPAAILFFIGTFELLLFNNRPILRPHHAFAMMGFSICWVMQIHLSFVLLIPFTAICFLLNIRKKSFSTISRNLLFFTLGAAISGSLLLPTYCKYGIEGAGRIEANIVLHLEHLTQLPTIITRFLSFSSYETSVFLGYNLQSRLQFLQQYPWFSPFTVLLTLIGFLQVAYLFVSFFCNSVFHSKEGKRLKWLVAATIVMLYLSFIFSIKGPSPHTFYVLLPVSMLYAFYCYQPLLSKPIWKKMAALMLILGLFFHLHLAHNNFKHHSLYKNRTIPEKAIDQKNNKILGDRRAEDWGCCY
ncbi:MAG: hypothetical protein R3E32_06500 [Chitinophagales bacterium]